ncbi:unnamed protein product, partial [marine sediment metagenome]
EEKNIIDGQKWIYFYYPVRLLDLSRKFYYLAWQYIIR